MQPCKRSSSTLSHLISLSEFNLPLIGSFYMTHAARALQSHELSGEGIKLWITDIHFWPHKDMEGFPGWVISPMPGPPPRQHKHERQYTPSTHSVIPTRRIWNDDYGGQMIFGDLMGLKFPDICLTGEEKPRRNLTRETCPDRGSNPGPLRDKRAWYHYNRKKEQYMIVNMLNYICQLQMYLSKKGQRYSRQLFNSMNFQRNLK